MDITQTKKWRIDGNSGKKAGIDAKEKIKPDADVDADVLIQNFPLERIKG